MWGVDREERDGLQSWLYRGTRVQWFMLLTVCFLAQMGEGLCAV